MGAGEIEIEARSDGAPVGFVIVCERAGGLEVDQYWANLRPDQRTEAAALLVQTADQVRAG